MIYLIMKTVYTDSRSCLGFFASSYYREMILISFSHDDDNAIVRESDPFLILNRAQSQSEY